MGPNPKLNIFKHNQIIVAPWKQCITIVYFQTIQKLFCGLNLEFFFFFVIEKQVQKQT